MKINNEKSKGLKWRKSVTTPSGNLSIKFPKAPAIISKKDFFFKHSSSYILNKMPNMGKRNIQYLAMFMLEFYPQEFKKSDKKIEVKVPNKKIKPYDVFYI